MTTKPEARNDDDLTFREWCYAADRTVQELVGLSMDDLPDSNTWDAWFDCVGPISFAKDLMRENGMDV